MTAEADVLVRLAARLEALQIDYMITGSVASSFHGRPRRTHDADIVIDPTPETLDHLVRELAAEGFYVDAETARAAFQGRSQFNAIDVTTASRLDLIIRRSSPSAARSSGDAGALSLRGHRWS